MLSLDLNLKLQNLERHRKLLSWAVLTVAGTLWLCPGVCPGSLGELVGSGGSKVLTSFRKAQAFPEKTLAGRPVLHSLPSSTD